MDAGEAANHAMEAASVFLSAGFKKRDVKGHAKAVGDVLFRALDATRPRDSAGSDPTHFARFAAWWAIAGNDLSLIHI